MTCETCHAVMTDADVIVSRARPCAVQLSCRSCVRKVTKRRYYQRKSEACKASGREYRSRPDIQARRAVNARAYRVARRSVLREKLREWRAANPEASQRLNVEAAYKRRCRMAGVVVERFSRDSIFIRDKGLCAYCGLGLDPQNWHLDHVVAIARGGGHTRGNVVASCPICNMKKGAREVA